MVLATRITFTCITAANNCSLIKSYTRRTDLRGIIIGNTKTRATMENINPLIEPTAKENQNSSSGPSIRNGINPHTVDRTVRKIGIIL